MSVKGYVPIMIKFRIARIAFTNVIYRIANIVMEIQKNIVLSVNLVIILLIINVFKIVLWDGIKVNLNVNSAMKIVNIVRILIHVLNANLDIFYLTKNVLVVAIHNTL